MITHYDIMNGLPGSDYTSRTPTAGGAIAAVAGTTLGSIVYDSQPGIISSNNIQGTYQYANALPHPGFHLTWTIDYDPTDNATNVGFVIAPSSAFATYVEITWSQVTQLLKLDNNGAATSTTTTFTTAQTITFDLLATVLSNGVYEWTLSVNGAAVLNINTPTITAPFFLFPRIHGPTAGGQSSHLTSIIATDLATKPSTATSFLSPSLGIFAQYTPASPPGTSSLRLEYPARSIVLKDTLADLAATWFIENTPAQLITRA